MTGKHAASGQPPGWFRLDNAAKIYPALNRARNASVFRMSMRLTETVDPSRLQQALVRVLPRFPCFRVRMRKGLFWFYFEHNPAEPVALPETGVLMAPIKPRETRGFQFRVLYHERRITVEFFHALTDGTGAMVFLKTLVAEYLRLGGDDIPSTHGVLDPDEPPNPEEMEDGYNRYTNFRVVRRPRESKAWHVPAPVESQIPPLVVTGIVSLAEILKLARNRGVSVTEYLAALFLEALYLRQRREPLRYRPPIRVSVPVNLRKYYPSKTLRNFALFVNPAIEPEFGDFSFDEILASVHHAMRFHVTEKYMNATMGKNVRAERNFLIRIAPLVLKIGILRIAHRVYGERRFTTVLSNIGNVDVPEAMASRIDRVDFLLAPIVATPIVCAVAGYGNNLSVTFMSMIRDASIQRHFFRSLVQAGIPVEIESNREEN